MHEDGNALRMVESPASNKRGREHTTGEGDTPPRRVMRSGSGDEPSRTTRSTEPVDDPQGAMITGIDEPEDVDDEPPRKRRG